MTMANEHGTVNAVRTHLARVRESHTKRQQGLSQFVQEQQAKRQQEKDEAHD